MLKIVRRKGRERKLAPSDYIQVILRLPSTLFLRFFLFLPLDFPCYFANSCFFPYLSSAILRPFIFHHLHDSSLSETRFTSKYDKENLTSIISKNLSKNDQFFQVNEKSWRSALSCQIGNIEGANFIKIIVKLDKDNPGICRQAQEKPNLPNIRYLVDKNFICIFEDHLTNLYRSFRKEHCVLKVSRFLLYFFSLSPPTISYYFSLVSQFSHSHFDVNLSKWCTSFEFQWSLSFFNFSLSTPQAFLCVKCKKKHDKFESKFRKIALIKYFLLWTLKLQ